MCALLSEVPKPPLLVWSVRPKPTRLALSQVVGTAHLVLVDPWSVNSRWEVVRLIEGSPSDNWQCSVLGQRPLARSWYDHIATS
jgi:hypothetical protein